MFTHPPVLTSHVYCLYRCLPAGGMSKNYIQIKKLMFTQPEVLHALLQKLADAIVTYIKYQVGGCAGWVHCFRWRCS